MPLPDTPIQPVFTRDALAAQISRHGWRIGAHSYGHPVILDGHYAQLSIGRFCSIARDVTIVLGNHRTDLVSTYPFWTLSHLWPSATGGEDDHESRGDVVIGDDVWIGTGCLILPGSRIGPGAVIAGHAVVRGEVPPYGIVAGNPARLVRHRFPPAIVERLLRLAWWDWEEEKLRGLLPWMVRRDIEAFLDHAEAEEVARVPGGPSPGSTHGAGLREHDLEQPVAAPRRRKRHRPA